MHTTLLVSEEDMQLLESVSQPAEQEASPNITLSFSQRKAAVQLMGLKQQCRKAAMDQLIVDHVEKTRTKT
jgi:hypothetical protein